MNKASLGATAVLAKSCMKEAKPKLGEATPEKFQKIHCGRCNSHRICVRRSLGCIQVPNIQQILNSSSLASSRIRLVLPKGKHFPLSLLKVFSPWRIRCLLRSWYRGNASFTFPFPSRKFLANIPTRLHYLARSLIPATKWSLNAHLIKNTVHLNLFAKNCHH